MKSFREYISETRFLHGTLKKHLGSIQRDGLLPGTSDFTKKFYDDPPDAVFLAHEKHTNKALASIRGQVAVELNKPIHRVTSADIAKHGALVFVSVNPDDWHIKHNHPDQMPRHIDGSHADGEPPPHAEPDDYYSDEDVTPNRFLTGHRMIRYFNRKGHKIK